MDRGYIYLRNHNSYKEYNCIKLGSTNNLINRAETYKTGEVILGKYIKVFQILNNYSCSEIEEILQDKFMNYHIQYTGGTEFYDVSIINLINNELDSIPLLNYKELTEEEILVMERKIYNKHNLKVKYNKFNYRYKQKYIANLFKNKLELSKYYGIFSAPTGYGKTFCYLFLNSCVNLIKIIF
jgi:CRISPR/Cas system-associated endonuclease/helicase Cas3